MRFTHISMYALLGMLSLSGCGKSSDDDQTGSVSEVLTELPFDSTVNLPDLKHGQPVTPAVILIATTAHISIDGVQVQALVEGTDGRIHVPEADRSGELIPTVYEALRGKAQLAKDLETESQPFAGRLLVGLDKSLPPSLVRQLIFSAGQAQFGNFRFLGKHPSTEHLGSSRPFVLPAIEAPGKIETVFSESQQEALFGPQLLLSIGKNGFSLSSQGHTVAVFGVEAPQSRMTLPCEGSCSDIGAYPWDELGKVLTGFRSQYPADCSTPVGGFSVTETEDKKPKTPISSPSSGEADELLQKLSGSMSTYYEARSSAFAYGFLPSTCVLIVGLGGRPDLPWPWWMQLDDQLAGEATFSHWVAVGGPLENEEGGASSTTVPLCDDAECSSVTIRTIHEDPLESGQGAWGSPPQPLMGLDSLLFDE